MINSPLKGMGVALITPFKSDKTIDFEALERLLEFHVQSGTDFLVALGTTAETATLSVDEQKQIVKFILSKIENRLPLVVGMGDNNTYELVKRIQSFDFEGIHSILSVTPYYNRPSQEGLFQHYKAVSKASPKPIILYNVPSRTGVNMEADTTLRIAHSCKNVIGVKEAYANIDQVKSIIRDKPEDFIVLSGDDSLTIELIKQGGDGVISVLANAFPKEFGSIIKLALKGEFSQAKDDFDIIKRCCELLFVEGNPSGVKCALSLLGYIKNELRLPLVPVSENTQNAIKDQIDNCNFR